MRPMEFMCKTNGLNRQGCSIFSRESIRHGVGSLLSIGILLILVTLNASTLIAGSATLTWNPNTDPIAGYLVFFGTAPGTYGAPIDVGNVTTFTLNNLTSGTYYFALKAYNSTGVQSGFSKEVAKLITATTPANHCDVNADGTVNALDLQMLINALLSGTVLSNADMNRDGKVDVLDLQTLNNVILGSGTCPP